MVIWPMVLVTIRDNASAFNLKVLLLSPWMIFAIPTFEFKALASARASNAAISLSD